MERKYKKPDKMTNNKKMLSIISNWSVNNGNKERKQGN